MSRIHEVWILSYWAIAIALHWDIGHCECDCAVCTLVEFSQEWFMLHSSAFCLKSWENLSRCISLTRPRQWSIFRAMRWRWLIFQQRCDTDYFLERLTSSSLRLFFLTIGNDYFSIILLILRTDYFAIIHDLSPHFNNSYSC